MQCKSDNEKRMKKVLKKKEDQTKKDRVAHKRRRTEEGIGGYDIEITSTNILLPCTLGREMCECMLSRFYMQESMGEATEH